MKDLKTYLNALTTNNIDYSYYFDLIDGSNCNVLPVIIENEKYYFKFISIDKLDSIIEEVKIVKYLIKNGIPIPKYFEKDGKTVFTFDNIVFYASKNVKGDENYEKDYNLLKDVIENIALMHKKIKKVKASNTSLEKTNDYFRLTLFYKSNIDFCKKYNFDSYIKKVIDLGYEKKEEHFIHFDLNFTNLIFENNKLKAFIDFTDIRMGYSEDELGKFFQSAIYSNDLPFGFIYDLIKIYENITKEKISKKNLCISMVYRIIYRYYCRERECKEISSHYNERTIRFLEMLLEELK